MKKFLTILLALVMSVLALSLTACKSNGEVSIKYADAKTIMEKLVNDQLDYGLLPEPVATKLEKVMGKDYTWHRMSVQDLYDDEDKAYPQAVLMVKEEVLEKYPQIVREMKAKFSENLSWIENNPAAAVTAVKSKYENTSLMPPNIITKTVVDNCKINWLDASVAEDYVEDYLEDIMEISIGLDITAAQDVEDNFFYEDNNSAGQSAAGKNFTFYAPDGAPALAIAKYIHDNQNFSSGATFDYNITVADDIGEYMNGTLGLADFIILPVNAASKAYNNANAKYKMVSVITHGNLYIMSKNPSTLKDLNTKTIGVIGQGKVPDLTLKCILEENNITYSVVQ